MNKKFNALALGSLVLTTSCFGKPNVLVNGTRQCNDQEKEYKTFQACDLELKDWYDPIIGDPEKADKVVLWWVGGPQPASPGALVKQLDLVKKHIPMIYQMLDTFKKENVAYVLLNQAQWLKQNKIKNGLSKGINGEAMKKEFYETIDKGHEAVKYFKDKGKKVLLGGESYGALLTNLYLSKYGDNLPDAIISQVGRLKIKDAPAKADLFKKGYSFYYGKNNQVMEKKKEQQKWLENFAWIFTTDYTKIIKDDDLSKVRFISAEPDQHVGWFNQEEINFAKSKKAKVTLFDNATTLKYFNNYKNLFGVDFKHSMGSSIKTFAHMAGTWSINHIKEFYIDPLTK